MKARRGQSIGGARARSLSRALGQRVRQAQAEEPAVKCVICRQGETVPGTTTVTLERDEMTLVIRDVPAQVCENCGERYLDEPTTTRLIAILDDAARAGVQVEVRAYVAA
jgi:YgiT-type zinc finger domain-containing protein